MERRKEERERSEREREREIRERDQRERLKKNFQKPKRTTRTLAPHESPSPSSLFIMRFRASPLFYNCFFRKTTMCDFE